MPVVMIANPKGGVGKSTLATQVAGYFASCGHAVMLGDVDVQQSSRLWLGLRPPEATPIASWDLGSQRTARPPRGTSHVVLDTPAGLQGARLEEMLKISSKLIVPVQPSIFDMMATRQFLQHVGVQARQRRLKVGLVGMRVDARTIAADKLREFMAEHDWPVLAMLRDTQNYIHLSARGLTLFDVPAPRVAADLAQWQGLCRWLDS